MCVLLQLPVDLWCDIVCKFLCKKVDLVHLDKSVLSATEKSMLRKCFTHTKLFNRIAYFKDDQEIIKWCCDVDVLPESVTFENGFTCSDSAQIGILASRAMSLTFCNFEFASENALQHVLMSSSTHLKSLLMANCRLKSIDGLNSCTQLTSLHLAGCHNITDDSLVDGVAGLEKLHFCCLTNCSKITARSLHAVLKNCPILMNLHTTGHSDLEEAFKSLSKPTRLRSFVAEDCQVTGLSVQLMGLLMPRLLILHLCTPNSSVQDADIDVLVQSCPDISVLELGQFQLLGDASLISIATHLKGISDLRLVLSGNSTITDHGVIGLAGLSGLTNLSIVGSNNITDESIRVVCAQLSGLSGLNVSECMNLTDRAFDTTASTHLTRLNVSGTQVNGAFSDVLLKKGEEEYTLCLLTCDNCNVLTDALVDFVLSRPLLYNVSLRGCRLSHASWMRFAQLSGGAKVCFMDISHSTHVRGDVIRCFKQNSPSMALTADGLCVV